MLAADIKSSIDVPPATNSAMDGYAYCAADAVAAKFKLRVSQRIPAGTVPNSLEPSTAARIFTGAEIPVGADTVALQENCKEVDGIVKVDRKATSGANIRVRGQDIEVGRVIVSEGTKLRAQELGLIASVGVPR